jgi:hypothetical protein
MATFCPPNKETYSLTDYNNASYPDGLLELLSPSAERDPNTNLLTTEACAVVYKTIVINDTRVFTANVISEYCYFNGLYVSAANHFLSMTANKSASSGPIDAYSKATISLTGNLIDLSTLVAYIGTQKSNDGAIQALANQMRSSLETLQNQLGMITSVTKSAGLTTNVQLYKEMEKYSRQKASYTTNLLAFYSFLNITSLGLLFYIYRSM